MDENNLMLSPREWLDANFFEDNDRDFKRELNFATRKGLASFIKDCVALCNYGGGYLIVGVHQDKEAGDWKILGVDDGKIQTEYDSTRLMEKINGLCSPAIHLTVRAIDYDDNKILLIQIAGTDKSPVIIKKDMHDCDGAHLLKEGSIYIRDQNASVLVANERHIRSLLDRIIYQQVMIEVAKLKHGLDLLGLRQTENENIFTKAKSFESEARKWLLSQAELSESLARREFFLYPVEDIDIDNLKSIAKTKIECNTWHFPFYAETSSREGTINTAMNNGYAHTFSSSSYYNGFWLTRNGHFFWLASLKEDSRLARGNEDYKGMVGVLLTQISISCCLLYLREILPLTKYKGGWKLIHRLVNVKNRNLEVEDPMRSEFSVERKCYENTVEVEQLFTVENITDELNDIALRMCVDVYQMFNWSQPNVMQIQKDIEAFHQKVRKEESPAFSI